MNISTFLALRYFFSKSQGSFIFLISKLTFLGIFTATFSLTLALMITTGFEQIMQTNLQGLNSDGIIISNFSKPIFAKELSKKIEILKKENFIESICPIYADQIILKEMDTFFPVTIYGVGEKEYSQVNKIEAKIKRSKKDSIQNLLSKNMIIAGEKLAQKVKTKVGESLIAQIPTIKKNRVLLKEKKIEIGAIISTGLEDYDNNIVIAGTTLFKKIFNKNHPDFFMLKIKNHPAQNKINKIFIKYHFWNFYSRVGELFCLNINSFDKLIIKEIQKKLPNHSVLHWSEISPAIMASMKFERFVITLILLLLLFLGLINISSLLFIKIMSKKRDIAILNVLGMSIKEIADIFTKMGCFISILASISGITFANIAGILISKLELIQLPEAYFTKNLPIKFDIYICFLVFLTTNILVFFVTKWPTRKISQLNISQILRG